ncbi:MAG: hypothetical protein AUJ92_04325 [Armatimonadetes bacterium CG2_30_59_28]|nr:hypothetical protein [Armatimonadota bacterium]OIO97086.1 MAG: hypothetical protein AUJ92_04325 [Armatimonadetes bacterium CG2_30_59_28]PIU64058.1 MAG: hypothetical protein COS85_13970 [Armatimonadetes bacterium CG07_land_8_20_14_0_80_59_28]PIY37949.1 MAG: hypothetical protein COZ05_21610 [Armatimonadetes bacterium CG_4_10_14_3_um_filter_59_10]PJB64555.1 MAG: hypothetical protein CO095_14810 [Armatimonadetes bacterium CG_4_9_14_3_um_filter_58_7]
MSVYMQERLVGKARTHWLPMVFLAIVAVLFFHEAIFTEGVFYQEDIAIQMLPLRAFAAESVRNGHLPTWCPNVFAGYPIMAEGQVGFFYPLNAFFLLPIDPWVTFK